MKKLKLNLQQLDGVEVLTRSQLKQILGGDGGSGGPCDSCTQLCHEDNGGTPNASYNWGMCSPQTGGTSCHNYCCQSGQSTYWC